MPIWATLPSSSTPRTHLVHLLLVSKEQCFRVVACLQLLDRLVTLLLILWAPAVRRLWGGIFLK